MHPWPKSGVLLGGGQAAAEVKIEKQGVLAVFSNTSAAMSDVTYILSAIESGDACASERLLPLIYDELRNLAAQQMAREASGHTLSPTALVHEAYLRLVSSQGAVSSQGPVSWNSRGHFFCAAAEAMRRILIDEARRKQAIKHGGGRARLDVDLAAIVAPSEISADDLIDLGEAIDRLEKVDRVAAKLVCLRYFVGLTGEEAAQLLGVSARTGDRIWVFARSWLLNALQSSNPIR